MRQITSEKLSQRDVEIIIGSIDGFDFSLITSVQDTGMVNSASFAMAYPVLPYNFEINKSIQKENTLELEIYNLSEQKRNGLQDIAGKNVPISVAAGYKNEGLDTIFRGQIESCVSDYQIPNWITKIKAIDGLAVVQGLSVHQAFGTNTKVSDVLKYANQIFSSTISASAGVRALGQSQTQPSQPPDLSNFPAVDTIAGERNNFDSFQDSQDRMLASGTTMSGDFMTEIKAISKSLGIDTSIQDGELVPLLRVPSGTPGLPSPSGLQYTTNSEAIIVSAKTGMIGKPSIDDKGKASFQFLIRPKFKIGSLVEIRSEFVTRANGLFRIEKMKYKGSSIDINTWTIDVECSKLKG